LGVSSIEEARQLDAFFIRNKYGAFSADHPRMGPVADGCFSQGDSLQTLMQHPELMVPIMAGNTKDEFFSFIAADSDDDFKAKAAVIFGDKAEAFLSHKEAWQKDDKNHYAAVSGLELTIKALYEHSQSKGNKNGCYYYRFEADIPGWDNPGAFHSVDLWFFFETLAKCWRPFTGRHYDLARQMCDYFCYFIKNGSPNGIGSDGIELPVWDSFQKEKPCAMVFTPQGASDDTQPDTDFKVLVKQHIITRM
jgi:para-nitrobenzyl esterase